MLVISIRYTSSLPTPRFLAAILTESTRNTTAAFVYSNSYWFISLYYKKKTEVKSAYMATQNVNSNLTTIAINTWIVVLLYQLLHPSLTLAFKI